MATETVILRPINLSAANLNTYPKGLGEYYVYVNEEISDDDATYLYGSSNAYTMNPRFDLSSIPDINSITAMRFYSRVKSFEEGGYIRIYNSNWGMDISVDLSGMNTYSTYVFIIDDISIIQSMILEITDGTFEIQYQHITSTNQKNKDVRVTQMYLEVDYNTSENIETLFIYNKKRNNWSRIKGTLYLKENDNWVQYDPTILSTENNFSIINLNDE